MFAGSGPAAGLATAAVPVPTAGPVSAVGPAPGLLMDGGGGTPRFNYLINPIPTFNLPSRLPAQALYRPWSLSSRLLSPRRPPTVTLPAPLLALTGPVTPVRFSILVFRLSRRFVRRRAAVAIDRGHE